MIRFNWKLGEKEGFRLGYVLHSHLAQWGYVAGYLTISEAQAVIEPAAKNCASLLQAGTKYNKTGLMAVRYMHLSMMSAATGTDYEVRKAQIRTAKS